MADVIERIVPCIWITPIDCFWEGAKALGPHPPIETKDLALLAWLKSIPNRKYIQWTDFDPMDVINEIHRMFNLGSHHTFFERAGVGHGYLDRPCMNPLDPECPKLSPNYYDVCPMLNRFRAFAKENNITLVPDDFSHDVYEFDLFSVFSGFYSVLSFFFCSNFLLFQHTFGNWHRSSFQTSVAVGEEERGMLPS
ncbi:hypothetical protein OESDEN_17505 [Oesophagostomum dentatum]|uniref:Uncharacterized protein n=1 Tax=Oesophagostomum dentatum TaxID=61180 RepID=A0A0B1SFY2_OESDE|nr:hypothetical protein OESDEN_17505 [Oesophagostomum dentatum]